MHASLHSVKNINHLQERDYKNNFKKENEQMHGRYRYADYNKSLTPTQEIEEKGNRHKQESSKTLYSHKI